MHPTPGDILTGIARLAAVVVVAVAAGYGLGIGLDKLRGDGADAAPSLTGTPVSSGTATALPPVPATAATTTRPPTSTGRTAGTLDLGDGLQLEVQSATFVPASSEAGKARNRGRLAIKATVTNKGQEAAEAPVLRLVLREAGVVTRPDPNATEPAGPLLQAIPPGGKVSGELRFETVGESTAALANETTVNIRLGARAVRVTVD